MTIRVMLVDDHRLVREALRDALAREPGIAVVGEAGEGAIALELARTLDPDVVVLDIGLPDLNGMEVAARLQRAGTTRPRIVALSGYSDRRFVTEMLRAGAVGYVAKSAAGTELARAIRAAAEGQSYFCPQVAAAVASELRAPGEGGPAQLGRREREVLRLIAAGHRSQAIAAQLHISVATVDVHRRNIMRKLDLHTVADLTKHAIREGIAPL